MSRNFWAIVTVVVLPMLGVLSAKAETIDILALGASNTYGKGVPRQQSYPSHLQQMLLAHGVMARVRNAGINGNTTEQMRARMSSAVKSGS